MLAEDRRVGSFERLLLLKKAPHIGTLESELLALLADAARPRVFRRGQLLASEGERVSASHFVVDGRLHLVRAGQVVGHAEPGAALGGLAVLARTLWPITVSADRDTLTLELDADTLLDLLEDHFSIMRHVLREVTRGIIAGWQRLPPGTLPPFGGPPFKPAKGVRDLDLVERIFYLRQVVPFQRASINALAELARGLSEIHLPPGARLWSEGEAARHTLLVVDGAVECRARSGFRLSARPGVPLGALESMAGRPRFYDADVVRPLTGLAGDMEMVFDVFEDNLEMALNFLTVMSQWLMSVSEQLGAPSPELGAGSGFHFSRMGSAEEAEEPGAAGSA